MKTLSKILLGVCLPALLAAQTAQFPSAVASDESLKVAVNNLATRLRSSITAGDTAIRVSDPSRITANMLLSIDLEIVNVVSVAGDTLTVVRGFDGTTAVSHATNRVIEARIDAWHHNSLKEEVKAIETALGPGLSNLPVNAATLISNVYNFAAQAPGNALTAAIINSITLTPCPAGVAGTNTNHYVYLSGGTGTAEAVLVSGGTCTSGAATGTLMFTPANAHSGAYTITSATLGLQEAFNVLPSTGGTVHLSNAASGINTVRATTTIQKQGGRLICASLVQPLVRATGVILDIAAGSVEVAGCGFEGSRAAGNIGIKISTGVRVNVHDIRLDLLYGGILINGGFHNFVDAVWGRNLSGYVIKATDGVSPFISRITYDTDGGYDVPVEGGVVINTEGAYVSYLDILNASTCLKIEAVTRSVTWAFIDNVRCDQNFTYGIAVINNSAYSLTGVWIDNSWANSTGMGTGTVGGLASTNGVGFTVYGTGSIANVRFRGGQMFGNRNENVKILKGDVVLEDNDIWGSNVGAGASVDSIYTETAGTVKITGGEIRAAPAPQTQRSGVTVGPASGLVDVSGVTFNTSAGPFSATTGIFNAASTPSNVTNSGFNPGEDNASFGLVSAATMNLPVRSYFILNGTTTIDTLQPAWMGRKLFLSKVDAGTLNISAAANVRTAFTLVAGETAVCEYIPSKWICRK